MRINKNIITVTLTTIALCSYATAVTLINVGKQVPQFSMTDVNELSTTKGTVFTRDSLKGKVVLIDFWGAWCPPCKKATADMQKLHEEFKEKGLVVLGANVFAEDDSKGQSAVELMKMHKHTYPLTLNNDKLFKTWSDGGIPFFIIVDRKGIVQKTFRGYREKQKKDIRIAVQNLIKKEL